ncbi:MAG: metallophosphoesterase family protein [Bacteroidetes bacterium]|nr:metallophosphoesterase family protein [Bacteroidota bacterium]
MKRIGLLSDTHNYLFPGIINFFKDCDEIWHAGDMGTIGIAEELSKLKIFRGVYGNIDGQDVRKVYPKDLKFMCENVKVWITHIGGYPGKYAPEVKNSLFSNPPNLFICGHSHILKVIYDKKFNFLHINPGAAGKYGLHAIITAVRFVIEGTEIKKLEILEIERK